MDIVALQYVSCKDIYMKINKHHQRSSSGLAFGLHSYGFKV